MMEKVNPDFEQPEKDLQEQQPATTTTNMAAQQKYAGQPDVQYADSKYKMIAPALKMINTPEKFAGAFKGWFEYLGYSPQAGNINIARVRSDVEAVLKQLGYRQ